MVFLFYLSFVDSRMGRGQKIRNRLLNGVRIFVLEIDFLEPRHRLEKELIHSPVEIREGVTNHNQCVGIGYVLLNPISEPRI